MKSMTGFGRADGARGATSWYFEIKSVNGRGLDLRFRLGNGSDALEPKLRERLQSRVTRGSINVNLQLERAAEPAELRLNEAALSQVLAAAARVRELTGAPAPAVDGLLAMKGVLELVEVTETDVEQAARFAQMLETFDVALDRFIASRAAEGARLAAVVAAELNDIETLVATIKASPARRPDAIAARLAELIARLTGSASTFDLDRLHQEAVLIATRADVEEELQRLTAHIQAARDLLADGTSVGRKFDFLTQEFNREANTLCSKSNDPEISRAGLQMKVLIDQMREQAANIE